MSTTKPPNELWLGMVNGQWPVHAFTVERDALRFLESACAGERRHVWKATVTDLQEFVRVAPAPYLEPKDSPEVNPAVPTEPTAGEDGEEGS